MKENFAGKTWNQQLIVNKFSFTAAGTLHYVVYIVIMISIILLIWAFVLYHVTGSMDFAIY